MKKILISILILSVIIFTQRSIYAQESAASTATSTEAKYLMFLELHGLYGKGVGDLPYTHTNRDDTSTDNSRANTYSSNNPTIFGGGFTGGFYLTQQIPATVSFDFQPFSVTDVIERRSTTNERTYSTSGTVMTGGIGIRPTTQLFSMGYFYGGGGLLIALPASATNKTVNSSSTSDTTTIDVSTNLGLGAYAEVGFQFAIGRLYIGLGTKVSYLLVNNNGTVTKQVVTQNDGSGTATTETTHSNSFSPNDASIESAKSTTTVTKQLAKPVTANLSNAQIILAVGIKI